MATDARRSIIGRTALFALLAFAHALPAHGLIAQTSVNGDDANAPPGPLIPAGSVVVWIYVITNDGADGLTDVTVTDNQGVAVTCPKNTLASGESMACTASGIAVPGPYMNIGTATATDPVLGVVSASDPSHYFGVSPVDLAITVTDGVATAVPGTSVTYTIVVSNAGPAGTIGSTVTDVLPAALTGASWTCIGAGGGMCTAAGAGNISDSVNLPAAASVTYTVTATVAPAATGNLTNTATATADAASFDPNPADNSATDTDVLTPQADLAITVTDGVATAAPGGPVAYTIVATNAGPSAAPGATVTDILPAGLGGATWTCTGAGGGTCTAAGAGDIGDAVNLPAGGSVTYTLTATVSPAAVGNLTNTATITAGAGIIDPNAANDAAGDTDALVAAPAVTAIPTLSEWASVLLSLLLAASGALPVRKRRRQATR